MTSRGTRVASIPALALLALAAAAGADEAKSFRVTPGNAAAIEPMKDHVSIRLVSGWTSAEDSFFQSLLSKNDKLAVSVASDVTNFDGTKVSSIGLLLENSDIARRVNKPWGAEKILVDRVPAETAKIAMTLRAAIDRSSRLGGILGAVSGSAPAALELGAAEWFGYTRVLVAVLDQAFGTDRTRYPFIWTGDLRSADMRKEHYIVLLAKNGVNDRLLDGLTEAEVSYDGASVMVRNRPLANHSYAVLAVVKSGGYDIAALSYESKAPWAALAQASFLGAGTFQATSADQLHALARTRLSDLDNELVLLKEEPRFSSYDRVLALRTFATAVRRRIAAACGRLNLGAAQCPTGDLDFYIENIGSQAGLPAELQRTVATDAEKLFAGFTRAGFVP